MSCDVAFGLIPSLVGEAFSGIVLEIVVNEETTLVSATPLLDATGAKLNKDGDSSSTAVDSEVIIFPVIGRLLVVGVRTTISSELSWELEDSCRESFPVSLSLKLVGWIPVLCNGTKRVPEQVVWYGSVASVSDEDAFDTKLLMTEGVNTSIFFLSPSFKVFPMDDVPAAAAPSPLSFAAGIRSILLESWGDGTSTIFILLVVTVAVEFMGGILVVLLLVSNGLVPERVGSNIIRWEDPLETEGTNRTFETQLDVTGIYNILEEEDAGADRKSVV